jgi:molecular chaperone DnaJ
LPGAHRHRASRIGRGDHCSHSRRRGETKIPEGTQSGSAFRLRNKGIVSLGEKGRGDQFVTVNVAIPTKLTKEQRQAFEALAKVSKDDELVHERDIFDKVKDIFG